MKTLVLVAALTLVFVPQGQAQEKWSIYPEAVERLQPNMSWFRKPLVTSSFILVPDALGIESNRLGGACLVANLTRQGIGRTQCEIDADCNPVIVVSRGRPDVPQITAGNYWGYCQKSHDLPSAPKVCWVRPGPQGDYCLTSLQLGAQLEPEKRYALPKVVAHPTGRRQPVSWRVVTCLNPPTPPNPPSDYRQPCSDVTSSNKQVLAGPVGPK